MPMPGARDAACSDAAASPISIEIDSVAYEAGETRENILLDLFVSNLQLGGFDLLMAYDPGILDFLGIEAGELPENCGWEYLNYGYDLVENSDTLPPLGLIRVIGAAVDQSSRSDPLCTRSDTLYSLLTMRFQPHPWVQFGTAYPIRFYWVSSDDNILWSRSGDSVYVSRRVYDSMGNMSIADTAHYSYPSFLGGGIDALFPDAKRPSAYRHVDFTNGSITIER